VIFDSHMHVGDFPLFNVSLDREGLATLMRETGISQALLFSPDNELVREIAEEVPGVWALYWANPHRPDATAEARAFLEHPRFRGIKFHPLLDSYHPNDPSVHPLMELAGERGLPVLFHTGHPIFTLPWSIEEVAANFPETKVVFGHMGHGNVVYINASIDIACRRPNVYLETSGMPMHTKIKEAIERVGETRVLFGSDVPFHHATVEIDKVRLSGLPPELVARVLGKNGRLLFFGAEDAETPVEGR
jgi:predicted TIM-barrel fold metal-dependent hydrolase